MFASTQSTQQPNTNSGYSSWMKHPSQLTVVEIINNSEHFCFGGSSSSTGEE
jgi:hypothetical protein